MDSGISTLQAVVDSGTGGGASAQEQLTGLRTTRAQVAGGRLPAYALVFRSGSLTRETVLAGNSGGRVLAVTPAPCPAVEPAVPAEGVAGYARAAGEGE